MGLFLRVAIGGPHFWIYLTDFQHLRKLYCFHRQDEFELALKKVEIAFRGIRENFHWGPEKNNENVIWSSIPESNPVIPTTHCYLWSPYYALSWVTNMINIMTQLTQPRCLVWIVPTSNYISEFPPPAPPSPYFCWDTNCPDGSSWANVETLP